MTPFDATPRAPRRRRLLVGIALLIALACSSAVAVVSHRHQKRSRSTSDLPAAAGPRLRTVLVRPPAALPARPNGAPAAGYGARPTAQPSFVRGRLLVKFKAGTSPELARAVLAHIDAGVSARVKRLGVRVVDVSPAQTAAALSAVRDSPAVAYVERDVAMTRLDTIPNDALWSTQWGARAVAAPKAWDAERGSPATVVAVLDTGVDAAHPDLEGALVPGTDIVNGDADPADDNGHGTAAAGVIAARTNNGRGQAGICWACSIMPVKVLDASGSGDSSTVAAGIIWAADHGARVISMSLGGAGTTQTLTDAVDYAVHKGIVLVAAAGNSGSSELTYPAAYPDVVSVAGTTESGSLYGWSNFGSWVQVAAPGCNTAPWNDGGYVNFCGTSSATPVVAGIAGLLLSANPQLSANAADAAIRDTAVPLGDGAVRYGRVQARTAVAAVRVPAADHAEPGPTASAPTAPAPTATTPAPGSSRPATAPPAAQPPTGARPAGTTRRAVYRGVLTRSSATRGYTRILGAGELDAELSFGRGTQLTVSVLDAHGARIASASGLSPLRLSRAVAPGRYRIVVSGRPAARTQFTLTVAGRS